MRYIFTIAMLWLAVFIWAQRFPPLPECYHTYAEITTELLQLQEQYAMQNIARVYVIGHTQQENLPIYAIRISDHADQDEQDEPAVLFIGQVHAEEVLGVEIVMSNINKILQSRIQYPYSTFLNQLEMWFIPTLNPEGHNVVTSNLDQSFRKNKRDNNNNGIFDFTYAVGADSDGVDINRNFDFNFCHGDTLWQPESDDYPERYDYYRGPSPMSEAEAQALKAFCDEQKPVYGIVWHSSRSDNLSENVYYPFNYSNVRPSPDLTLSQQIGEGVASQILKASLSVSYVPSAGLKRKGALNDWLYQQYGTICLLIECGKDYIQPDSLNGMASTVTRCSEGVWWLLKRSLRTYSGLPGSMLKGTVTDAATSLPLKAEVIVEERNAPWFAPRTSFAETGWFFRPVINDRYTLRFRKKGYFDYVANEFDVNPGTATSISVSMQPIPPSEVNLTVTSGNTFIPSHVVWSDVVNDVYDTSGEIVIQTYAGIHRVEISANGFYPYIGELTIAPGAQNININLSPLTESNILFSETWENGITNWTKTGDWVVQSDLAVEGHALTDSWGGWGFYSRDSDCWIKSNASISLPLGQNPMLVFEEQLYTEFVYDSVRVEISDDGSNWQCVYSKTGKYDWWHPVYVSLAAYSGQNVYLRFRLTDHSDNDIDLTDPGWTLDNIRIITGAAVATSSDVEFPLPPLTVYPIYPNPSFRNRGESALPHIRFAIKDKGNVQVTVYNIKGQKVRNITNGLLEKGSHQLIWNGTDDNGKTVGSGIYFCRLKTGQHSRYLKMVLMK